MLLGVVVALIVLAGVTRYATGVSRSSRSSSPGRPRRRRLGDVGVDRAGRSPAGPAVTGVLQASLANLPEFFVVIFALGAGETVIAQTAILGSILVNALLVLGLVIVAGAGALRRRHALQPALPNDTATLLLVARSSSS